MTELISLAVPETQEAILRMAACPTPPDQLHSRLVEQGFEIDHVLEVNVFWLLKSGELTAGKDYFLASGQNPHQLSLPFFDNLPQSA